MKEGVAIFWFRRDLRLEDNAGLYHALKSGSPVLPLFIFDRQILDKLENKTDRRVEFIHASLGEMQQALWALGSGLELRYGQPGDIFRDLVSRYSVAAVFTNADYEPYATERDREVAGWLAGKGIPFYSFKDHVIFEKEEVLKEDGKPYTVFTPYSKKWKTLLTQFHCRPYPVKKYDLHFHRFTPDPIPSLSSMGFQPAGLPFAARSLETELLKKYKDRRDFPGLAGGTSRLGIHLRFGTCSIRQLAARSAGLSETFLTELIWRDFYHMILWHFPSVGKGKAFKPAYEYIPWRNNEQEFEKWCQGLTGYPIVDAGMRELNGTGFMHNRVRMIAASFLTKHLLIDWRWGEAYFAEKLLDFDLAANNGGWQWAAGSGCDAAPYFRVFSPALQTKKFDPDLHYIRRWVPEWESFDYPSPIVPHEWARKRALEAYGNALKKGV